MKFKCIAVVQQGLHLEAKQADSCIAFEAAPGTKTGSTVRILVTDEESKAFTPGKIYEVNFVEMI